MSGAKAESGIIEYSGANTPGWVSNLGLSLAGGVLTITDAQGDPLTPSNPGWVTVPSAVAGQLVSLKVTASYSFNDDSHASSSLTNLGFGITESSDWSQDVPFFIYVINLNNSNLNGSDGGSVFAIARSPTLTTSPASSNDIGDTGTIPSNDSQSVILILDDVTIGSYTSVPMQLVGALRMRWVTSTDDWTVQALGSSDGFGQTQLDKIFATRWTMPVAQNGAAAGTYLMDNAGTAPLFTTNIYRYTLSRDGYCGVEIFLSGDPGADGAGAVVVQVTLPYAQINTFITQNGISSTLSAGTGVIFASVQIPPSASYFNLIDTTGAALDNGNFSNGGRSINVSFRYKAF